MNPLVIESNGLLWAFSVTFTDGHDAYCDLIEDLDVDPIEVDCAWDPEAWLEAIDATADHPLSPLYGLSAADAASLDLSDWRPMQPPAWIKNALRDTALAAAEEAAADHVRNEMELAR